MREDLIKLVMDIDWVLSGLDKNLVPTQEIQAIREKLIEILQQNID